MYAHNALLHALSEMQRQQLGTGMRSLHVGATASVALQTILGLALGITQVLPKGSSPPTARTISEHGRTDDVSELRLSAAVSGALSSAEASSLRQQLTRVRVDHGSVEENGPLIAALVGEPDSPLIRVYYDTDAATGVSSYSIQSEPPGRSE
jgi:hypothetical protein